MRADPARWTLMSRTARRVCGAARAYRLHVAVRGCTLLGRSSPPTAKSDRQSPLNRSLHERVKRRTAYVVSVVGFFAPHRPFSQCGHPAQYSDQQTVIVTPTSCHSVILLQSDQKVHFAFQCAEQAI